MRVDPAPVHVLRAHPEPRPAVVVVVVVVVIRFGVASLARPRAKVVHVRGGVERASNDSLLVFTNHLGAHVDEEDADPVPLGASDGLVFAIHGGDGVVPHLKAVLGTHGDARALEDGGGLVGGEFAVEFSAFGVEGVHELFDDDVARFGDGFGEGRSVSSGGRDLK